MLCVQFVSASTMWEHDLSGTGNQCAYGIVSTNDGGFVLAGDGGFQTAADMRLGLSK